MQSLRSLDSKVNDEFMPHGAGSATLVACNRFFSNKD